MCKKCSKLPPQAVGDILKKLINKELIEKRGSYPGTYYVLKK
jgi:sugar-specific transcriptional regulator TrmB